MQRQDVNMVLGSLDRLGDSLLRSRMIEEQKKARGEEMGFRQNQAEAAAGERAEDRELRKGMAADTKEFRAKQLGFQESQAKATAEMKELLLKDQQSQQALANLQKAYDSISGDYKSGVIDKAEANRRAKALVDKIKLGTDALLSASPFASMLESDGDLFSDKPEKPAPSLTPDKVGNRDVAIGPGGAVHYTDTFAPADAAELRHLNDVIARLEVQRAGIQSTGSSGQKQRTEIDSRIVQTEAKKQSILGKYKGQSQGEPGGTPPPPGGERVTVQDRDGKKFTVPRKQLSEAIQQGYSEVK